jgi:uncharacterized membrane protein YraQ (UPF0718 family)
MWDFTKRIAFSCWDLLIDMAPYVLLGFLAAGILAVWLPAGMVERHLGGRRRFWPVLKAALIGIPIPLCCCGVIPLASSLRRQGAAKGPTTAFLISTPQTGVDSILVTYSLLGPVFAVLRPLAAFISGILGGLSVAAFDPPKASYAIDGQIQSAGHGLDLAASCGCDGACAGPGRAKSKLRKVIDYGFLELPKDLARPFVVGLLAAGLLAGLLPPDFFQEYLGHGLISMLVMLAVGAPLYICATAAVPLAAAFLAKGLSPGAVLVFLMAAPATNLATIVLVGKVMGPRALVGYLTSVCFTALSAGLLTDACLNIEVLGGLHAVPEGTMGIVNNISALILSDLLLFGLWRTFSRSGHSSMCEPDSA